MDYAFVFVFIVFPITAAQPRRGFKTMRSEKKGGIGKDKGATSGSVVDELRTTVSISRVFTKSEGFLSYGTLQTPSHLQNVGSKRNE